MALVLVDAEKWAKARKALEDQPLYEFYDPDDWAVRLNTAIDEALEDFERGIIDLEELKQVIRGEHSMRC